MTVSFSVPNSGKKSKSFYKLMSSELKEMYQAGLLDAPAYVLLIVKTQRAAGWKWTFKVKDFCLEWGINERTFYRAVSKLKSMNLLHWETNGIITVWHGTDIATNDIEADSDVSPADTDDTATDTNDSKIDTNVSNTTPMAIENAETIAVPTSCPSLDLIRSSTDSTESVEEKDIPVATPQQPGAVVSATDWNKDKAVEEIVALAQSCGYYPTQAQCDQLNEMNETQFEAVNRGLNQLKKHSSTSKSVRFDHALRMGKYCKQG